MQDNQVKETTTNINKDKFDYKLISATKEKKGIILFIHGFCVSYTYFVCADQFPEYDVYLLNLPGHSQKNKLPNDKKVYKKALKFSNIVNYVVDFINAFDLSNVNLIGHSMGGAIASLVENKVRNKIRKIVLISPMNLTSIYRALVFLRYFFPKNMDEKMLLLTYLYYNIVNFAKDSKWNDKNKQQLEFQLENWNQMSYLGKKQMGNLNVLSSIWKAQKRIEVPMLLCLGVADGIIPFKMTKKLFSKQHKNNIEIVEFNNSAHLCFEEETDKFVSEVTKFLNK